MQDLSRRDFMRQVAWAGALGSQATRLQAQTQAPEQRRDKPNVVLIMTDTQRLDDMGAYGNSVIRTPHLDRLARAGVMFRGCHTQYPACMPARATVFTGRYPMAHGVWSNGVTLPRHEVTLAQVFADHGYRTGGAGKFHFQPHFPYRKSELPLMETHPEPYYGFQEFHLGEDGRSGEQCVWIKREHPEYYGFVYIESVDSGAYTEDYRDNYGKRRNAPEGRPADTLTMRSQKWRFTVFTGTQTGELYDLQADPHEFVNLFHEPSHAAVKAELMAVLLDRMAQTRDPLPLRTKPY